MTEKLNIEDGWIIDPPDELLEMRPAFQAIDFLPFRDSAQLFTIAIEKTKRTKGYVAQHDRWNHCRVRITEAIRVGWSHPDLEPHMWVTPTDEDAKHRPEVEVRDSEDGKWLHATLACVKWVKDRYPFLVVHEDGSHEGFVKCRMRADAPHRKGAK